MVNDPLAALLAAPAPASRPARRESLRPAAAPARPATPAPSTGIRFLVQRTATTVRIRAFDRAAHPRTEGLDKRAAWEFAQRLAQPAKSAQDPKRKLPAQIVFTDVDGTAKVVAANAH